ncbi:uncharacterized protein G2W53_027623 [Senna tora]|uniref:Uncharacterized protein n=1 Tax=Senna tora TaxID=362788 RepID=A0A834WIL1_9FABA|nr:uncharacterized protein G2W53_027623 [Senna tora]
MVVGGGFRRWSTVAVDDGYGQRWSTAALACVMMVLP